MWTKRIYGVLLLSCLSLTGCSLLPKQKPSVVVLGLDHFFNVDKGTQILGTDADGKTRTITLSEGGKCMTDYYFDEVIKAKEIQI